MRLWRKNPPTAVQGAKKLTGRTINPSIVQVRNVDGTWVAAGPPKPSRGAIQLPITHGGGSRRFVSSSTMDVKTLKEVRDIVEGVGCGDSCRVEWVFGGDS